MDEMDLRLPPTQVDIAAVRRQYHAAAVEQAERPGRPPKGAHHDQAAGKK
jgi:hypothetical protein